MDETERADGLLTGVCCWNGNGSVGDSAPIFSLLFLFELTVRCAIGSYIFSFRPAALRELSKNNDEKDGRLIIDFFVIFFFEMLARCAK